MHNGFCLFQSAIDLAHDYWRRLVQEGDAVVDATCGNGYDTQLLAELCGPKGSLWAFDVQSEALEATRARVGPQSQLTLCHDDHARLHHYVDRPLRLAVYNLGYLPGGDKSKTTQVSSTLTSVEHAAQLLQPGGALSITCYPGHAEGAREEAELVTWAESLDQREWSPCWQRWVNRRRAPSLLLIQKATVQQSEH